MLLLAPFEFFFFGMTYLYLLIYLNWKLYCRLHYKKRSYDLVDYKCIDKLDFWVLEDEDSHLEFEANEDIENVIYQENPIPIVGESSRQTNGGENDSEINILE